MLTRFHKGLLVALVVQIGLLALVLMTGRDTGTLKEHALLPGFDAAKVTKLTISSSETKPAIELTKASSGWVVSSAYDYPVDDTRLTGLLGPLAKMSAAAPIATQAGRHKQLRVADDDYERKVVITADGKTATLFIGGSAGTRRNAVRFAGDDDVYAVTGVTPYLAGDEPRDWIAASYTSVGKDDLAKITIARAATKLEFTRGDATAPWALAIDGAGVTEPLDTTAIDRLVNDATSIAATTPGDPKRDASKPAATITIEQRAPKADDKSSTVTPSPVVIDVVDAGSQYWVKQRDLSRAVMVDKAKLDAVVQAAKDKLVKPPAAGSGAGSGSAARPIAHPNSELQTLPGMPGMEP
jgi:hypothetical protein